MSKPKVTKSKSKLNIKKNDQVMVVTGKDKGKQGKVLYAIPAKERVIVEGLNMIKRHSRPDPRRQSQGGILKREAPVHLSNVMLVCPKCSRPTRLERLILDDGTKNRVCKKCGEMIDKK